MVRLALAAAIVVAAAGLAAAGPPCVDRTPEERAIDDAVSADAARAGTWNVVWGITFGVAAIGTASIAAFAPDDKIGDDSRASLYVTAGKASLAALVRVVRPLRIDASGLCEARGTERRAKLIDAARREKKTIIVTALGGLALNTAGLLYLGFGRDAWRTGWISFGLGTAVGLTATLTAPRRSWMLKRRLDRGEVIVAPVVTGDYSGLALVGSW